MREEVEELHDRRMCDARIRERLGREHGLALRLILASREEALDDDASLEVPGEQARGEKDLALPAEAEATDDPIGSDGSVLRNA